MVNTYTTNQWELLFVKKFKFSVDNIMSKKIKILCLSRAPLDFFGGIPSTCLNLYKDIDLDVTSYSYSIKNNLKKK